MNIKSFPIIILLFFLLVSPSYAEDSIKSLEEENIKTQTIIKSIDKTGQSMSLINVSDYLGSDVELSTGKLNIKQTDFVLPGKNGFNFSVERNYNSGLAGSKADISEYNSPIIIDFKEHKDYYKDSVFRENEFPKINQWHGYMGGGWQFNIGGQLFIRKVWAGPVFNIPGQSSPKAYSPYQSMPSIAVAQIENQIFYFNGNDLNDNYKNNKKGGCEKLEKTNEGYILYLKNGIKYKFNLNYFHLKDHKRMNTKFIKAENHDIDFYSYYLTSIEDIKNNKITFNYDKGKTIIDKYYTVQDNWAELSPVKRDLGEYYKKHRLLSVVDGSGRNIKFGYDGQSNRISEIKIIKGDGQEKTYNYGYDNDGFLTSYTIPDGRKEKYDYTGISDNSDKNNNIKILSNINLTAGGRINYSYININDSENTHNYCVSQKRIIGNGKTSLWFYDYSGSDSYNNLIDNNPLGITGYFKKVNLIDPIGNSYKNIYTEGLLLSSSIKDITLEKSEWDFQNRRPIKIFRKNGLAESNIIYEKYDQYGNPLIVRDTAGTESLLDDIITVLKYQYSTNNNYLDKNILNLPSYSLIKECDKTVSEKSYIYDDTGLGSLKILCQHDKNDGKIRNQYYYYDEKNNLIGESEKEGQKQKIYSYDPTGTFIIKEGYPNLGLFQENTYDFILGLPLITTDFNKNITRYEYDISGRTVKIIKPDKSYIEYVYNDQSNEILIKNFTNNNVQTNLYSYNQLGLLTKLTDSMGFSIKYRYDELFRLEEGIDQENKSTRLANDIFNNIISIEKPNGSIIKAEYNYQNNQKEIYDEMGRKTTYVYNPFGNLVKVLMPCGAYSQYQYCNSSGLVKSIKDFRGLETSYVYNNFGNLKEKIFSDNTKEKYIYDDCGNLICFIDRNGIGTDYNEYDDLGRYHLEKRKDPYNISSVEINKCEYDKSLNGAGYLTKIKMPKLESEYTYNTNGKIISKSQNIYGKIYKTYYEYDQNNNITKIIEPLNQKCTLYEYNNLNKICGIKTILNGNEIIAAQIIYTPCGFIKEIKYPFENTNTEYIYDRGDRLVEIKSVNNSNKEIIFNHKYKYDLCGNRISLGFKVGFGEDNISSFSENINYSYDLKDQLKSTNYSDGTNFTYNYDNNGNRTYYKFGFGAIKYNYDLLSDKLLSFRVDSKCYIDCSYDKNGNVIRLYRANLLPEMELKYSRNNMIKEIIEGGKTTEKYEYDYENQRIKKTGDDTEIIYHYDEMGNVISESNLKENNISRYIYALGQRIARIDMDDKGKEIIYFYYNDILGSPWLITSGKCRDQSINIMDPFGNTELAVGGRKNRYKFTGKEEDESTAYYYFNRRYYDPLIGRFLNVDPAEPDINDPQTINSYIFCKNNPMKFVDYEGERTFYINGIGNPGSGPTPEGIKMHKYYNFTNKGLIKDFKILGGHKNAKMFNGIDLKGVITTSIEMMNVYIYSRSLSQYILSNIKNYPLDKGEELNIISYSGGGQIALNIAEQLKGKIHFNNIVLIGSPVIQKDFSNIDKIYYLYGNNDRVVKHSNYLNIIKNDNQIKKINLGNLDHNDYFHNDHIFNVLETIGNCIN